MNFRLINFLELFNQTVQYSVPRWQRRYSWGKSTIQQLIRDLETISKLCEDADELHGNYVHTFANLTLAGRVAQ